MMRRLTVTLRFCAQEDGDACTPRSSMDALMKFAHCVNLMLGE